MDCNEVDGETGDNDIHDHNGDDDVDGSTVDDNEVDTHDDHYNERFSIYITVVSIIML